MSTPPSEIGPIPEGLEVSVQVVYRVQAEIIPSDECIIPPELNFPCTWDAMWPGALV